MLCSLDAGSVKPQSVLFVLVVPAVLGLPRWQVRQAMRAVADRGEFRVMLDDAGLTVANAESVTPLSWPEQRYHLEAPELFPLLGGDEEIGVMTVLPKRGTDDPGRLGELIARHSSALPQATLKGFPQG
ncbi:hypothetical protein ACIG5E_19835 [Kitasatospora sp. NPDC053057]|uniref:hypothetical protein n=1 Tax=Kitasatospora sp. NPDC053057 TaxID=3364062 RepID=UPI0037C50F2B